MGYYCSNCNQTFESRPEEGLCPECPAEPVFDLSNPVQRAAAYATEAEEKERASSPAMPVSVIVGLIGGVLFGGPVYFLTDVSLRWESDLVGVVTFVASLIGAIGLGGFAYWLVVRRARSGLPDVDAVTCVACGAAGVEMFAADAYRCRHCGHEGGEGLAAAMRDRLKQSALALPAEERDEYLRKTLNAVDLSLEALEGGLSGSVHQFTETREDSEGTTRTHVDRDTVLAALSRDVAAANNGLIGAATLLEDSSLDVDLHAALREVLLGTNHVGGIPPQAGQFVRKLRERVRQQIRDN